MSDNTDTTIFKLYNQDKWCIRPLSWCGIWRNTGSDIELVSGNTLGVYGSHEEAKRVLEEMKNEI